MREKTQTPAVPNQHPGSEPPEEGHEGATEEDVQPMTPTWADLPDDHPSEPPDPAPLDEPEGDPKPGEPVRHDPKPGPERSKIEPH